MNVEIGTDTPIFLFWEYLFRNFGILSLQWSSMPSKIDQLKSGTVHSSELEPNGGKSNTPLWVRGWGGPNADDWNESLALCILRVLS